jgi:hypothetical protein
MSIRSVHRDGWIGLTSMIIEASASLPGAACTRTPRLFDEKARYEPDRDFVRRSASARRVCATCPVRRDCINWVKSTPPERISGVLPASPQRTSA